MFTDNPTIPAQLEVLLDVLYEMRDRKSDRETLRALIQPNGLPGVTKNSQQVYAHIRAAEELGLARVDDEQNVRLTYSVRGEHRVRHIIAEAFDRIALGSAEVEPWAGRFYAYLIANEKVAVAQNQESQGDWSLAFMNALPTDVPRNNPMNPDKFRSLMRWYVYIGLGWIDPSGAFVPDPTRRLQRSLKSIWVKDKSLNSTEFMMRLGASCPELDGGAFFKEINVSWPGGSARECTGAVATALWRLHDLGALRLHCPADSKGWSLERGGSGAVTGEGSNRFDSVERVNPPEARA